MRPNFDKCEKTATKLLLRQNIGNLFIDVRKLRFDKKILFDTFQNYCRLTKTPLSRFINNEVLIDGLTIVVDNMYVVLFRDDMNYERLNWTLAHEIGHIYLNHKQGNKKEEIEAHYFAAQLLMPEIVLLDLAQKQDGITADEISEYFHVSHTAACKRIKTITNKYKHCMDLEEQSLLKKFQAVPPLPYSVQFAMG